VGDALTSVLEFVALLAMAVGVFVLIGGGWGLVAGGSFLLIASFVASVLNAAKPPGSDE
jgi:hypothetical protein